MIKEGKPNKIVIDEHLTSYLKQSIPEQNPFFQQMEKFAIEHRIPIMDSVGIHTMLQIMKLQQPKKILEIGTAIGYSALRIADSLPNSKIVTIEMDLSRVEKAKEFIAKANKEDKITLIEGNALEVKDLITPNGPFDAIFIDAAKAQYQKFFHLYEDQLTPNGCFYIDNILFKGIVFNLEGNTNKRLKNIAKKIDAFLQWLLKQEEFETMILPVGDGLVVSRKIANGMKTR